MINNYLILDASNNYVNIIVAENQFKASEGYPNTYIVIEDTDSRYNDYLQDLIANDYYKTPPA